MSDIDKTRYDHHEPRDRSLRVSNADREAAAGVLRREHLAGRLDSAEFEARLTRCFAAKSYADLDELMADFPIESRMPRRFALSAAWPLPLPLLLLPLVAVAIVAGILTHGHFFWLAFPLFFFVFRPLIWGRRGYRRRVYGGCWGP